MDPFDTFLVRQKPRIRPPWTIPRAKAALGLDGTFVDGFGTLSRRMRGEFRHWADRLLLELMQMGDITEVLPEAEIPRLRHLAEMHGRAIMAGRFDEAYFDTLDDLALFFIYHDIWSSWMTGAIKHTLSGMMADLIRHRSEGGRLVMMQALTDLLVLELDQIQRVYTLYYQDPTIARIRQARYRKIIGSA